MEKTYIIWGYWTHGVYTHGESIHNLGYLTHGVYVHGESIYIIWDIGLMK